MLFKKKKKRKYLLNYYMFTPENIQMYVLSSVLGTEDIKEKTYPLSICI